MSQNSSKSDDFRNNLNMATTSILTAGGIIGNSMVIYILTKKAFRRQSMFRYYSFLVFMQTLELLTLLPFNIPVMSLYNNLLVCKCVQYFSYSASQFISWLSAFISLDRFMSVKYLNKFAFRNKIGYQVSMISTMLLISLISNIPHYYFTEIFEDTSGLHCSYDKNPVTGIELIISYLITNFLVPFVFSLTFNCLTGYQLINNRTRFDGKTFLKEKRLFKILISMDFFFFFCFLIWFIYKIVYIHYSLNNIILPNSMVYFYYVAGFFYYCNGACSFFVFIVSNRQFRKYFSKMIRLKRNRVGNMVT